MALYEFRRVLVTLLLLSVIAADDFNALHNITIQVFTPTGFRASIAGPERIVHFAVQGVAKRGDNIKEVLGETGSSSGETDEVKTWVVDLPLVELKVGDELNFLAFAAVDSKGYIRDNIEYTVTELKPFVPLKRSSGSHVPIPCDPTPTRVRNGFPCAGQTIFDEQFDFLREDIWQVEKYLPIDHPELPFVSYQPLAVSVQDGNLRIVPSLQQDQPDYSQSNSSLYTRLDLRKGCTKEHDRFCYMNVEDGHTIVPPIISGRLISQPGFAFTYGTISIRAKLPQGDWIYPELLLEPLMKKFAYQRQDSGMLKIACARGNKELIGNGSKQYGNKVLYSGAVLNARCHNDLLKNKSSGESWGDKFHLYSVKWTNESLIFSVDGEEYATLKPEPSKGLRSQQQEPCHGPADAETGIEPFDDLFYITLGLAVGGRSEFPDATVSKDNHAKPWKNGAAKATIHFWDDAKAWKSTWHKQELLVDYVKVVAL